MSSWLKGPPAKAPPVPGHVNIETLMGTADQLEAQGMVTPALTYIRTNGPQQEIDKWGEPLPLSSVDQARLDRLFAILSEPYARGRALLLAGMLIPDEVDALMNVYPDVWMTLATQAWNEMHVTHPPYPLWAETTLGVLFAKPADVVFTGPSPKAPDQQAQAEGTGIRTNPAPGTQADRREAAVRSET